ncbi:MAG: 16S rRNA (uracil(1498)-N(3))-methyltransferase, partial [Deltaproteobacteria bacterium]
MNLLLLVPGDFFAPGLARLTGRRHRHLLDVLRGTAGATVRVGLLDGPCGEARIRSAGPDETVLEVALSAP